MTEGTPEMLDTKQFRSELHRLILKHFNEGEFRQLCFFLDVNFDVLGGYGLADKTTELIAHCERHGKLAELLKRLNDMRPHVAWPEIPTVIPPPVITNPSEGKTVEIVQGGVKLTLVNIGIGKWNLTLENQTSHYLNEVNVVFSQPPKSVVGPLRVKFIRIKAGSVSSKQKEMIIRPNDSLGNIFELPFELALKGKGLLERQSGKFEIPI